MNALSSLASVTPLASREKSQAEGEVLLACPVGKGAMVLFGWHTLRLPRQGAASLTQGTQAARGAYRLHAWAHPRPGTAWFVAALQLRDAPAPSGAALVLHAAGQPDLPIAALPGRMATPEQLAAQLATHAARQPGPVALFLAELCLKAPRAGALRALLAGFLHKAAEDDGVVEIAGQADGALMLQGWGRVEAGETCTALLCGATISRHAARLAAFPRPDIAAPATGVVALLENPGGVTTPAAVHFVVGGTLRRRPVLAACQVLTTAETGGHLADILPRLDCDPETRAMAQRMTRPRFTGVDTLATLDRPVRAAIDLAAVFPGAGVYLSGWLIDPGCLAQAVTLCGTGGLRVRLDQHATRLPRPDVAEAFRADARFAAHGVSGTDHGLAVFAETPAGPDGLHLEVELGDSVAFLPLRPTPGTARAKLRRVLESIDLHRPGAHAAIRHQLGPLLRRVLAPASTPPPAEMIRRARAMTPTALLLPMPPRDVPPQTALSFLLSDAPRADEGLVLLCPPCWTEQDFARLDSVLRLYAHDATVLRSPEALEWTEALDSAAHATQADMLVCLGAGVLGVRRGWRASLAAVLEADPALGVAFPTTLYEDHAVRGIGVARLERLPGAPWVRPVRPGAGQPASALSTAAPATGVLAGAHVRRAAWQKAGGFAQGALLAETHEITFFRRLAAGTARWVSAAQVYALDDPAEHAAPHWRQVARLADGWCLAETLAAPEPC